MAGLYQGPLEDFVARRTQLVRERRSTDPDAAAVIAKLRKPPVGVWAIDQLAGVSPGVVTELLAAGADARDAHQNVATGSERREDLLVASARLRDGVESAARAAAEVLEGAGHAASDETDRRIRATLQAAATGDVAQRVALWKGTLDRELDVTGFGAAEKSGDDPAELAEVLAPLRRSSSPAESANQGRAAASPDLVARRHAERDAAGLRAVAKRARAAAAAKRGQADRLAEEARAAAEEASAAEQAADGAEEAASRAEAALDA